MREYQNTFLVAERNSIRTFVCLLCVCPRFSRRRRETSYDAARLLPMAPIDPWRNSTPDFGAVAFCTTNIEYFRTPLTSTSSTVSSTYSSQKRSSNPILNQNIEPDIEPNIEPQY